MTTLSERVNRLPASRRKKVREQRVRELICRWRMSGSSDLRKARKKTQVHVAKKLHGIKQENVSRIEDIRSDLLISTLSGYIEASWVES